MTHSTLHPVSLRCEYRDNPLGIDTPAPRLAWQFTASGRGRRQTAYQVIAAAEWELLNEDRGDLWDSERVESNQSVHVSYAGTDLGSGQRVWWKVRVWDESGQASDWSEAAWWQMGLLAPGDWKARWITALTPRYLALPVSPYLRREFEIAKPVKRATLTATARGVYELHLNGQRVGDDIFAPGWTDYAKRIQYQTHDVTDLLQDGPNALGAILGDGWYGGHLGYLRKRDHYAPHPTSHSMRPLLLAQLEIEYADGTGETIVSDDGWRGGTGPIQSSDFLFGETYDARLEMPGWDRPGFDDAHWTPTWVEPTQNEDFPLVAQPDAPVRVTQDLPAQGLAEPLPGTFIFDLGQNMVGWARLTVNLPTGTVLRLRFGEMLNPDGTLYTTNLRSAAATDTYICKGGGETWEPRFTFHGFRFVELTGYPGRPGLEVVTGRVVHSDTPPAGKFECSNALVNQLQSNIVWGQRGNFLSIPTDCPQRDERLGWMGDAQIFVRTATTNCDVAAFFTKWMRDVEDAQSPEGGFPDIAPRTADNMSDGAPAWGDAGVIVPWTIYQVYGDTRILETHYDAMAKWVEYLRSVNPEGVWTNRRSNDFGDWLSIAADTDKTLLATAYYAYDVSLMARIARTLGRTADAADYDALLMTIKAAFQAAFVAPDGKLKGDTQTAYVLALHFDLLAPELRPLAAKHLTEDVAAKNGHLSTGFVGVGYLCPALTDAGYTDIAYQLLLNETFPSWGYSIRHGATTIWERWDGWTTDKGFQTPDMNSFNHYSLGSVGEWLYRYVAGIDTHPDAPGYERILIQPHPGGGLSYAGAEYAGIRGLIASRWTQAGNTLTLDVSIPPNTTATVLLPAGRTATLTEADAPVEAANGVTSVERRDDQAAIAVGSGDYRFVVQHTL